MMKYQVELIESLTEENEELKSYLELLPNIPNCVRLAIKEKMLSNNNKMVDFVNKARLNEISK